ALLDSVASGDINLAEMSLQKKLSILILASYLQRVDYVTMADSGAWEEGAGIRTSSVASVTSFLERVQEGLRAQSTNENEKQFFNSIFDQTKLTSEARNFLRTFAKSMDIEGPEDIVTTMENSFEHLDGTLDRAYLLFKKRLRRGKLGLVEVEGLDGVGRVDDAALLHTLLYAPARWNVGQRAYLAGRLESSLGRASGVIRYKNDGFLWELGIAYSDKLSQVALESPDQIAVLSEDKRGYRASTREDRDRAYQAHKSGITDRVEGKDLSEAAAIVGENLEAQWAFQDDMLVQIYSQLYIETGRVEYFDKAWRHLVRGLGQISGSNQFTIEGHPMASFRAVEAWVPVRVMVDGQVKTVYFASPNSPLNWAVAEKARGIVMFMKALKLREQNPVRR
ncbi:MAG TPA: hypothetical protein VN132_05705, partial [Bdellovibrio sp.]|nr:hypothetical protein [Bdellovibrio sp.]